MYLSCSETPRRAASGLNCRRILFVSFIAIALGGGFTNRAAAGCPTCRDSVRTQDQIWYISCRCAGCPDNSTGENSLTTGQYEPAKQQWQKSDLARFYAADDGRARTVFFVHGNQTSADEALDIGLTLYRDLVASARDEKPIRFAIWSWPSDRVNGTQLNDVRVKAPRADVAGYYLATVASKLNPSTPTTYIGFSYGARAVTAAMQLEGGGPLCGWTVANSRKHVPANVVLVAAATDNDWLLPGERNDRVWTQTDHLLNIYNSNDRVLRFYHFVYGRRSSAEALGYVGLPTGQLPPEQRAKVAQCDAGSAVGSQHSSSTYLQSSCVLAQMRPLVLDTIPQTAAKPAK